MLAYGLRSNYQLAIEDITAEYPATYQAEYYLDPVPHFHHSNRS